MTDKEGTLRMMASGRWAIYRPGRLPVEITSGELFRVEVTGPFHLLCHVNPLQSCKSMLSNIAIAMQTTSPWLLTRISHGGGSFFQLIQIERTTVA
jgi:hypothetical protein